MHPERIAVFLPCHSLDDFPTWIDDQQADDLLAAWTAAWHPSLIAAVGSAPVWASVEAPPADAATLLGIVPPSCDERFAALLDMAGLAGSRFVRDTHGRDATVVAARAALVAAGMDTPDAPVLVADFHALGLAWLLAELLARRMRSSTGLVSADFNDAVVAAARAAVSGDDAAARGHLRECFATLEATRAQYYPVDVWLLDLVLLADTTLGHRLAAELESPVPFGLLTTGRLLQRVEASDPPLLARLRERVADGSVEIVGCRDDDTPVDFQLLASLGASLDRGRATCRDVLGVAPVVFGQCTGGSSAFLPQLLGARGYRGAIWNLFDGTPLPDPGASRIRWQGVDGTTLDAVARPPLDARAPGTILQLAEKIGDAMDHDHSCIVSFAHYAGTASPWYAELRRMASWTTLCGRFVTPTTMFADTAAAGMVADFPPDAFPPTLPDERAAPSERLEAIVSAMEAEAIAVASDVAVPAGPAAGRNGVATRAPQPPATAWWRKVWGAPRADETRLILENARVRVAVHPRSGGVLSFRAPGGRSNRLSQVVAVRSTHPAPPVGAPWESAEERAEFALMVAERIDRESDDTIVSRGTFSDASGGVLGSFRQRLALAADAPLVRLDIDVELARPLVGPLFESHVACRFAWNENDDIDLCRSLHGESIVTERSRFTAPHFLELAPVGERSTQERVLIATGGLPWHLRSSPHTVDAILLGAGALRATRRLMLGLGIEAPLPVALALLRERASAPSAAVEAAT